MQEKRLEKKILITNKLGLHARAAAKFVSLTSKCESKFVVKKGKNTVSGSSLLGLMTLAASKGTEIKVQCIGSKAEQDLEKLIDLIKIRKEQPAFHPNATQFTLNLGSSILALWRQSLDRKQSIFAINRANKS